MASEVGSGQVAIFPIFKGFRRAVVREIDGATTAGASGFRRGFSRASGDAGAEAGRGFQRGFSGAISGVGTSTLRQLQSDVAKATQGMSANLLKVQDATGRVRVAQSAYNDVIGKYGEGTTRAIAAQERLFSAQRGLSALQETQTAKTAALRTAQDALKAALDRGTQSTGGFGSGLSRLGGIVGNVGSVIGSAFSRGMDAARAAVDVGLAVMTKVAIGAAAAIGAGIAATVVKGFSRLSAVETAQAKLTAIGLKQADVAEVLKNANDAVIGTQYSLADAVTASAAAVAAGIKPGQDLTDYLKTTANAAALAGVGLGDLGLVMNQVTSQNKAYTQDLNQVASRGIPIYKGLATVYGVSQAKLRDMLQQGQIDAEHFRAALKLVAGDAAISIGQTTVGAFQNLGAAVSRFGAGLLTGVFPLAKRVFDTLRQGLDAITPAVTTLSENIGAKLQPILESGLEKVADFFTRLKEALSSPDGSFLDKLASVSPVFAIIRSVFDALAPVLPIIAKALGDVGAAVATSLAPYIPDLAAAFALLVQKLTPLIPKLLELIPAILPILPPLLDLINQVLPPLVDFLATVLPPAIAGVSAAFKVLGPVVGKVVDFTRGFYEAIGLLFDTLGGNNTLDDFNKKAASISGPFGDLTRVLQDFGTKWGQIIGNARKRLDEIVTGVKTGIDNVASFFAALPGRVGDAIAALPDKIAYYVGVAIGYVLGIPGRVGEALAQVPGLASAAFEQVSAIGAQVVANVVSFFSGLPGRIGAFFGSLPGIVNGIFGQVSQVGSQTVGNLLGFFQRLPGQILDALKGAGTLLFDVGRNIVDGLVNGIKGAIGNAVKTVTGLGDSMLKGIKDGLGIHSPSRKFEREVGAQIPAGIQRGVERGAATLNAAVAAVVAVPGVASPGGYGSSAAGVGAGRGGDVYIDKVVAPDQNPVVSGRIMGREFVRVMAG